MVRIELTENEASVLSEIVETYLSDLRSEIVGTENREWRAGLKDRESIGRNILQHLTAK